MVRLVPSLTATDDRLTFLVTIPVHERCIEGSETPTISSKKGELGSEITIAGSEKNRKKFGENPCANQAKAYDISRRNSHANRDEFTRS